MLTAMGLAADRALGALRLSLGRWTTQEDQEDIETAAAARTPTGPPPWWTGSGCSPSPQPRRS
ncbi:hypothetical protein ABZ079_28030 [Streptomyces sp. NPDC006314]|uniref:hypothetical protein n=1 Tax=Streptomyces sp. NPDC006314 TaxID=3154475 RepID=UPI0033BBDBD3